MKEGYLRLRTGSLKFNKAALDNKQRALVLTWYADTEVLNVVAMRVVVLRLSWPPIQWLNAFTEA